MKATRCLAVVGISLSVLLLSACSVDIDRNADGSLSVAATMSAENLQEEVDAAIQDPEIKDVAVDLHDSYILVHGNRRRTTDNRIEDLTFRLDLGVVEGRLSAVISDAQVNDHPIDDNRVTLWNSRLANNLTRAARRHPNSMLTSVQITEDKVLMIWHIETARSRDS